MEFLENAHVVFRLPSFPIFWLIGAIVVFVLSGIPGLIGLTIIFLEVLFILIINSLVKVKRRQIGEFTGNRVSIIHSIVESLRIIKLYT